VALAGLYLDACIAVRWHGRRAWREGIPLRTRSARACSPHSSHSCSPGSPSVSPWPTVLCSTHPFSLPAAHRPLLRSAHTLRTRSALKAMAIRPGGLRRRPDGGVDYVQGVVGDRHQAKGAELLESSSYGEDGSEWFGGGGHAICALRCVCARARACRGRSSRPDAPFFSLPYPY
jgi:hypothetical protein